MSSPPKYQQLATTDDSSAPHPFELNSGVEVQAPQEGGDSVVYSYTPVWPRKGSTEHVVGLRGNSREQTLSLITRYFPSLSHLPPHLLSLELPVPSTAGAILPTHHHSCGVNPNRSSHYHQGQQPYGIYQEWAKITDEAWAGFARVGGRGPERVRVVVVQTEEEKKAIRRRATRIILLSVFAPILTMFFLFIGLACLVDA